MRKISLVHNWCYRQAKFHPYLTETEYAISLDHETGLMDLISAALQSKDAVPLPELITLGRQSIKQVFEDDEAVRLETITNLWTKLQQTARNPTVTDRYLTAACNALCVVLHYAQRSKNTEVRSFAFSREVWRSAVAVARKAFAEGKNKPALQVVEALSDLQQSNPDANYASSMLQETVTQLLHVIITGQPELRIKEACIITSSLLRKTGLLLPLQASIDTASAGVKQAFAYRCANFNIKSDDLDAQHAQPQVVLFLALLFAIQISESRNAALKLFSHLCSEGLTPDHSTNVAVASRVIQIYFNANTESLGDLSKLLFPAILTDQSQFELFLNYHQPRRASQERDLPIYLAILQVGREKAFVSELHLPNLLQAALISSNPTEHRMMSSYASFDILLSSYGLKNRLQAYLLLTASTSVLQPIPTEVFRCLIRNMAYLHDDSDPYYRDEFVNITRRFLKRVERSFQVLKKGQPQDLTEVVPAEAALPQYDSFLTQYTQNLVAELGPHVSYPRHILALHILRHLLTLEMTQENFITWKNILCTMSSPLFNLILDPFDDVRNMSLVVLRLLAQKYVPSLPNQLSELQMLPLLETLAARSNRGDHSDALGRLYNLKGTILATHRGSIPVGVGSEDMRHLVKHLADRIHNYLSTQMIIDPLSRTPLHGMLLGLAYLIGEQSAMDEGLIDCIYQICESIWRLVQAELCVDSPERASEREDHEEGLGPKDLLSYSWRALRDSSLVIQATINCIPIVTDMAACEKFGSMSLVQLINLRHRGAFSTVAQTFTLCCQRTRLLQSHNSNSQSLLGEWESIAFSELEAQASKLTRRSAGLPAIFCGLLDPGDMTQFQMVIAKLTQIASCEVKQTPDSSKQHQQQQQPLRLPQVHALNCLKDIMTNSRFRTVTEPIVVNMLQIAVSNIDSEIWAIRNCGLMLLRACINRITPEFTTDLSDSRSHDEAGIDSVLSLAIRLLSQSSQSHLETRNMLNEKLSETVFAALDILSRIPGHHHSEEMIDKCFESQFANRLWAVREYAARLRASNTARDIPLATIQYLSKIDKNKLSPNEIHSRLLCVKTILQKLWAQEDFLLHEKHKHDLVNLLRSLKLELEISNLPEFALSTYLAIINDAYGADADKIQIHTELHSISTTAIASLVDSEALMSNALLRREVILNCFFRFIYNTEGSGYENSSLSNQGGLDWPIGDRLKWLLYDEDAVFYALERITSTSTSSPRLLYMLMQIWQRAQEEDLQSLLMSAIADQIAANPAGLQRSDFVELFGSLQNFRSTSRLLFNSSISLTASLALTKFSGEARYCSARLWRMLLNAIRENLLDDIETSSRLIAIIALSRLLRQDLPPWVDITYHLECLLMVYDALNDDDDDVREVAASLSGLLLDRESCLGSEVVPSALAARKDLRTLMQTSFGHLPQFHAYASSKIVGFKPSIAAGAIQDLVIGCRRFPVQRQLEKVMRDAKDLFAEEKQNLYIDEVAELHSWSSDIRLDTLLPELSIAIAELCQWTNSGLLCLIELLEDANSMEGTANLGPLGPTYQEEMLLIFLRVVTMARVLSKFRAVDSQPGNTSLPGLLRVDRIRRLSEICHQYRAHHLVLKAFEELAV